MTLSYPDTPAARSRWIQARREPKNVLDPVIPYAHLVEEEFSPQSTLLSTLTILLTNRECPWKCLMCDLWQNTLDISTPPGAIPQQIEYARQRIGGASPVQVKLYNAGSFFDTNAIPESDYAGIARLTEPFERVIVECHPALIGERTLRFQEMLNGTLEVAIGLETVHPDVLDRLNKRFTVEDFRRAAAFLAQHHIALRVFLLLRPPFLNEAEGILWAKRSLEVAFECGATVCCVIPTRAGNGAMEALRQSGEYAPPSLRSLEETVEYGLSLGHGRVFADLWDIEKFADCDCSAARSERLTVINQTQQIPSSILCDKCIQKAMKDENGF